MLPGSAAMAGEILAAFGAGLPLSETGRGPLRLARNSPVQIEVAAAAGMAGAGGVPLRVDVRAPTAEPLAGRLVCTAGDWREERTVTVTGHATVTFDLPARAPAGRNANQPVHVLFCHGEQVATAHTLLHLAGVRSLGVAPVRWTAEDFRGWPRRSDQLGSVTDLCVRAGAAGSVEVEFGWADAKPVPAQSGYKNRFGRRPPPPPSDSGWW